ncbi:tyrosine-type recombinase/integrase [Shewanella yunxiaonensis]|uniref:Tyrosine-type recombinase/integrase n=1 Tax=Shewanella yunxiaonensis TaxID=2829809 RepID=A0ABX7YQV1_9GAMM|nr:integrase domain-containing protein [Shewanella yunxiaonensis]QUN04775.1 tyrosine-type recombinase/integrase [Shewanella yunxiaonensis]
MARSTKQLSDTEIRAAKPKDKEYNLFDGLGLRLRIKPNGSKLWLLNYTRPTNKKRANLSLGSYPAISLAKARALVLDARALLAENIDPKLHREQAAAAEAALKVNTFEKVASDWFEIKRDSITSDHAAKTWSSLQLHILPYLGSTPIGQVTAPMVISIFRPIEAKGSLETVKRLSQRINEIMVYAVNTGLIHANPLSGIKAAFKKPKKQHMAAMVPSELPELMQSLAYASIRRTTRFLIEWQLHTMTRPNEAAAARWDEINFDDRIWVIPAERMKMKKEHIIPLSNESLSILNNLKQISGNREYLFPADRDPKKHCNEQTANAALKRMGLQDRTTAHGLRSLASTTLNEQGFDFDVVEAALAHTDRNQVRSAYNRATYLERRREMMNWWSKHIVQASVSNASLATSLEIL